MAGSYACGTHTAAWASSNDQSGVALSYGTPGITDPSVTAAIGFTGEPHAGTFTDADADAKSGITVTSGGGYWGEQVGGGSPKTGSYTLVLTSVTTMFTNSDGKGYTVHGTLDGSLPVIAGGSGSVTVHVSF